MPTRGPYESLSFEAVHAGLLDFLPKPGATILDVGGYAGNRISNVRALANSLLTWADPERDTRVARAAVDRIRATGSPVYCVWSGQRLRDNDDVDHCFPFAAWPCGDAWNLMPASQQINNEKSNRLITQAALERSTDLIIDWWADAFLDTGEKSAQQFFCEAGQTLPLLVARPAPSDVIDAMKMHRMRLAKDQGLRPWESRQFSHRANAAAQTIA